MPDQSKIFLQNLKDERNAVYLYRALSEIEKTEQTSAIYRRMAEVEANHADFWEKKLKEIGVEAPAFKPTWQTRTLTWLARRFGVAFITPTVAAMERRVSRDLSGVSKGDPSLRQMSAEETSHARMLAQIAQSKSGGIAGSALAQLEGRHRTAGGNALRAAVLGANDGLVSNLSLVMGVAGAELSNQSILITGLAGLLAGACSMALGEWLSVQSSRELYQHQIQIEAQEILAAPEQEAEELALIYQSRGVEKEQAQEMARRIMQEQDSALDALAREELGIDPKELGGSAWEAAITSFLLFAVGAIIPVFPFIFVSGSRAIIASLLVSVLGLFAIGAGITLFTGKPLAWSGMRQVLFGLAAAAITFTLGRLIGASLGG